MDRRKIVLETSLLSGMLTRSSPYSVDFFFIIECFFVWYIVLVLRIRDSSHGAWQSLNRGEWSNFLFTLTASSSLTFLVKDIYVHQQAVCRRYGAQLCEIATRARYIFGSAVFGYLTTEFANEEQIIALISFISCLVIGGSTCLVRVTRSLPGSFESLAFWFTINTDGISGANLMNY